jgi:hypothetical protein
MRKFILTLILALCSAAVLAAATKYENISDPKLEVDAKAALRKQYPALTDHDVELLWGYKAVELYYKDRGEKVSYEM